MAESVNGSAQPPKGNGANRRMARKKPGFIRWSLSLITRLATWAAILTILFRCPATLEECDETSPFVCKHYFQVKNAVAPHAKPYYDQHAAPYLQIAQPYYETAKTHVFVPARHYAVQYGEPWVVKGRDYALAQWEVNGQPRIAQLQAVTQAHYDMSIAPHVSKAAVLAEPYYNIAKMQTLYVVDNAAYPAYEFSKPYALKAYEASHKFTVTTVLPAAQWTWTNTNAFLDRAVWPQLRVVYVENVEPQLVRIGERLGRYKSHAKSKVLREAAGTRAPNSSTTSKTESTTQSYVSKPAPQSTTPDATESDPTEQTVQPEESEIEAEFVRNSVEAPEPEENETDRQRKVREMVAQDLESWQEKFAAQAEQGAAEIEDSVDEIARRMIDDKANIIGASLIEQLEETISTEIANLKEKINSLVSQHLEGAEIDAQEETIQAVRAAGVAIKSKAQIIRGWREQYDDELQSTVTSSSDAHFAILDETRSLALQQIGMKWAWSDGVTYKDWAKYHELKSTLSDWTDELKQLIVTHPTLLEAQDAVVQMEDRGMTIAAAAAKELASLKEVTQWKIDAEDVSDEFDANRLKETIDERARLAEEARLQAEEEARIKAEEEARAQAEEEARVKAEEEAKAAEAAEDEDDEDERIQSVKEASESKPLVSEDVDAQETGDDRIQSVKKSSTSEPLVSASAVPDADEDEAEKPAMSASSASEETTPEATPEEAESEESKREDSQDADEGGPEEDKPKDENNDADDDEAKEDTPVQHRKQPGGKYHMPVQPRDHDAVDR